MTTMAFDIIQLAWSW